MGNITLSSYSIRVIRINSQNKEAFEKLDKIDSVEGADIILFQLFKDYLENIRSKINSVKGNSKKIWRIDKLIFSDDGNSISGIIGCGEGGYKEDIVSLITHNVDYQKKTDQAGLSKYYFLIHLPRNTDMGYLILQRQQNRGIKGIFVDMCNEISSKNMPKYNILLPNVFSKEYFERMRNSWHPREIRIITKYPCNESGDLADYRSKKSPKIKTNTKTVESILKSKYGGQTRNIIEEIFGCIIKCRPIPDRLFEEIKIPANYDKISLVVSEKNKSKNGRPRTRTINNIDLDNYDDDMQLDKIMLPYHDITDFVVFDENDGYPTFDSIHSEAKKYLQQLICENTK